jgi:hypothetical protein
LGNFDLGPETDIQQHIRDAVGCARRDCPFKLKGISFLNSVEVVAQGCFDIWRVCTGKADNIGDRKIIALNKQSAAPG